MLPGHNPRRAVPADMTIPAFVHIVEQCGKLVPGTASTVWRAMGGTESLRTRILLAVA